MVRYGKERKGTPQRKVAGLELHPGGLVGNEVSVIAIAMQGINRVSERYESVWK